MSPPTTDQPLTPNLPPELSEENTFNKALLAFQKEIGFRYDPPTVLNIMHKHDLFWYAQSSKSRTIVYLSHVNGKHKTTYLYKDASVDDIFISLGLLLGLPIALQAQATASDVFASVENTDAKEVETPSSLPKSLDDPLTEEEIESIRMVLKAQTPEVKRDYPIRFKVAFPGLVPDDARAVTPYHTTYRHARFFQDYIDELEGIPAAD